MAVLEVRGLRTEFRTDGGTFAAVDGVDFTVEAGRTLAIVGESGCGKSVTALSIMGLVPAAGRVAGGSIRFEGRELVGAAKRDLLDLRGNGMAMIFQEPMTSLNPAFPIGEQIVEGLLRHWPVSRAEAQERALEVLRQVRIPAPEQRFHEYPHKLSGGMRQRAMIAMALACRPRLLIADEPTTALDVTIQAQILELMRTLQAETGTAVILITHDLGVVAEVADEVAVMYSGRVVERASAQALFDQPQHPYTVGLLGSIPRLDVAQERLAAIEGQVPDPLRRPAGCSFADRCPFAVARCRAEAPPLREVAAAHQSACWRAPLDPDVLVPHAPEVALAP
ncbi:ABC transporter ATP-binding protein [Ramlibacter sp. USB13]|uniref:ABC transporter ATP-binding protein n=1 Tax=Ramlibacter cellulosilyticus TaxID=2764187 RepID=A0A923S9P0_9BURK|nr:ABC transporter ATP-binding protein [Ramlibacter cellulosilyticus]MBC5781871.1 ABC transporter ATP-binding protein [Ramlibacter cellulosilyticus]